MGFIFYMSDLLSLCDLFRVRVSVQGLTVSGNLDVLTDIDKGVLPPPRHNQPFLASFGRSGLFWRPTFIV